MYRQKAPRALPLALMASKPLAVDTPTWHAALASAPRVDSTRLKVLTWNVWFDEFCIEARLDALVATVLGRGVDVVCFQEVLPEFAAALRASSLIKATFDVSANDVKPYGCMMLVRRALGAKIREVPFEETNMGRSLLIAELHPSRAEETWKAGLVGTVHLESLNSAKMRRWQLAACARELSRHRNAILCGDFNFDDTQEWGDWRRKCQRPASELENRVLSEVLPSFADQWPILRPSERGATFDGGSNPVCVHDRGEVMRYDRVMLHKGNAASSWVDWIAAKLPGTAATDPFSQWAGRAIEMLGTEDIGGGCDGLKPSDHYGLEFVCSSQLENASTASVAAALGH